MSFLYKRNIGESQAKGSRLLEVAERCEGRRDMLASSRARKEGSTTWTGKGPDAKCKR